MPKFFAGWLGLLALAGACQPTSDAPGATITPAVAAPAPHHAGRAETMRLHDALMGRTDSLLSEGQRLQQRAGQLDTSTAAGHRQAARLRRLRQALGAADARMMDWMHQFQPDTAKLTAAQTAAFWVREQQTLRRIQTQTSAALDSARQVH